MHLAYYSCRKFFTFLCRCLKNKQLVPQYFIRMSILDLPVWMYRAYVFCMHCVCHHDNLTISLDYNVNLKYTY